MKHSKAYEQVFGGVRGGHKTVGVDDQGNPVVMRVGKTARDKANGHVPGKKNRRNFDDKARVWVKV